MIWKRCLAALLCVLMLWPSVGLYASAEAAFIPADPPQGMYPVLQTISERRQIPYRKDGYRASVGVTYDAATRQTPVEDLALYMNVFIDNPEGDVQDLIDKARYRQIDIQRYLDGEYYEVRWSFNQFKLQRGWNRLLLRFDTAKEMTFQPADERMIVANANRQTINWDETATFNFALTMVEDSSCSQFTIILDDVAIVDTSRDLVNEARPVPPDYRLLQDIRGELPDQELTRAGGGYQVSSAPIAVSPAAQKAPQDTMALYMNLYVEDRNLPYHTGLFRDTAVERRLTLSDGHGGEVVWNNDSFDQLNLKPGWNTVVWRLTSSDDVWDGIPCADTDADSLSLSGTLQLSMTLSGLDDTYDTYRLQIAQAALVDVARRTDGQAYYDTTYDVLRFSGADGVYTADEAGRLATGWILADGTSDTNGVDIHRHNQSGLRLMMTLTLESDADALSAEGAIHLRSADGESGQQGGYWPARAIKLKKGDNLLSLKLTDLLTETAGGPLDYTAVNRFCVELTGLDSARMTLSDVKLVDIAGRQPGKAALAQPSAGMTSADHILYNLNAVEWGADPTGEEDSTTAIQDCLDTLKATGGVVFLPAGRYQVKGYLSLPAGVTLRGEWRSPDDGGAGKGTILMAYAGADDEQGTAFIRMRGASCLRDISVWYPEQDPVDPVPYSATIEGQSHTVVSNITLYNAYTGFYNASCSSMLIRGFYATALKQGIYGANAYDIPRIEQVKIDTRYWIESGLPGAPTGLTADQLNSFTRQNTIGLTGGRQDWGYWYDIEIRNAKIGIFLFAGNDAVGNLRTEKVQYGIYTTNVNAPGLQITHSDISASVEGIHYEVDGGQTLVASATTFRDAPIGIHTLSKTAYGVSLNDCTFKGWDKQALYLEGGHLTATGNRFEDEKPAIRLEEAVPQALLTGNTFAAPQQAVTSTEKTLLRRDDSDTSVPDVPDYTYKQEPYYRPKEERVFLVTDYGAREGGLQDCTAAIQDALDAAGQEGGGTVYIPGGFYRLDGSLIVPSGVELRGSFDGAHYGNSTFNGTQLYVYGGKDDETAPPLITLKEGAGAKGFTVYYPEQGLSDKGIGAERLHTYPAVLQADKGCWIENIAMVNAYDGIDAMTKRCDGLVIRDVTGFAMHEALRIGHGIEGGFIHNFHLNPSGWGQQGQYPGGPTGAMSADGETSRSKLFEEYVTQNADFMTLGDCRDVQIFSSFDIIIRTQMHLIKDPYTGGSFKGTTWGIAFDASHDGIVCEGGIDADLTMIAAMGVFNQQGGGYNVVTKPGFTGRVSIFNADAWGGNSKIAKVEGGSVTFSQYFSASAYQGVCGPGGTLNFYSSVMISRSGDNSGHTPDLTYQKGSRGQVIGNLDCVEKLNVCIEPGAQVEERLNGARLEPDEVPMSFSQTAGEWAALSGVADTGWIPWDGKATAFNMNNRNQNNLRLWVTATLPGDGEADMNIYLGGPDGEEQTAVWPVTLHPGENRLSLKLADLQDGEQPLDLARVSRIRLAAATNEIVTLNAAQMIDLTPIHQKKQLLREITLRPVDTDGCRVSDIAAYEKSLRDAQTLYEDERANLQTVQAAIASYQQAVSQLQPVDKAALRALLAAADELEEALYTQASFAAVIIQRETARSVLADGDATQELVDNSARTLQKALDQLVKKPTRLSGDVNGDGVVTAQDALLALQAATHKIELSPEDKQAADIDGDTFVTAADSLVILQIATNKITQQ